MQGQVGGPQVSAGVMHTVLAPHLQAGGGVVSQEVIPQQEVIQATVVSLPQQVVHLTAPPVVSSTAPVANQQLVHTSSGTQLVTLPPGTQIINTSDGPRLVAIATGTQVAAPVAPVPASHQSHPGPLHDPQGVPSPLVQQQQPAPQTLPASVGTNHVAINHSPILSDGGAPPSITRSLGLSSSYSSPSISNTISTTSPHTSVAPHGSLESPYPPNVSASIPPPSTCMALGVPPPAAGIGMPPTVTANASTVSLVLTPGVNTTTTSGVGLLVPQDPSVASGQLHVNQSVVVAGVLPTSQHHQPQQQQHQQVPQTGAHSTFLGPAPSHQIGPSGYPTSQTPAEQPVSSAYIPSESTGQGYSHAGTTITSNTSHYGQVHPQQQRPVGVGFPPVGISSGGEGAPPPRIEYQGPGGPGVIPAHLHVTHLQTHHQVDSKILASFLKMKYLIFTFCTDNGNGCFIIFQYFQAQKPDQQQQQQQHLPPPATYYNQPNHPESRPVSLEQQWQQFQQQVKVEGGQQQYDPYSATEEGDHQDSTRQQQQQVRGRLFL